jgi:cold shock protein
MRVTAGRWFRSTLIGQQPSPTCSAAKMKVCIRRAASTEALKKASRFWFGNGWPRKPQIGKDVFVHVSAVERSGMRGLAEGMKISYEVEADRKSGKESAANLKAV